VEKKLWKWSIPFYLMTILIATLWPFNFWQSNRTSYWPQDGLRLVPPSTVYSAIPALKLSKIEKFTILVDLTCEDSGSNGYARILTYSLDERRRNFTLGQWNDCLVFLLRASGPARMVHFEVEGVLKKGVKEWVAIVFDGERLSLYRDGALKGAKRTGPLDFSDWERGYPLVIGSEGDGKFPWAGRIHSVAIFDRALNGEEIQSFRDREKQPGHTIDSPLVYYRFADMQGPTIRDHGIGPRADLVVPKYFTPYKPIILKTPSNEIRGLWSDRTDILLNFLCFIPLGFLFVNFLNSQGFPSPYDILLTIAIGFSLSLTIEILQAFLPGRESDLTDLITNTLGTITGSFLRRTAT